MKLKIVLKFTDEERKGLLDFQEVLNNTEDVKTGKVPAMSLEQMCRQAIFYSINDAYRRGRAMELEQQKVNNGISTEANTAGTDTEISSSSDANTNPLANSQASGDPSTDREMG